MEPISPTPGNSAYSPAISVEGLTFSYDGKTNAVDGVNFTAEPGEILGMLGPNGAGKSTTIRMLTGMLEPDGGTIRLLGLEMPADKEQIQRRIGVCMEEKNLYPQLTGVENLTFFAKLYGIRNLDHQSLLKSVGLSERGKDRVSRYSKGMRQRLMVARALLNQPGILFLDEPTDGLDPVSSRAVRSIIREEAEKGTAVVLTTHDMFEADELSDRVAFINEGKILIVDTPHRLKVSHGSRSVRVTLQDNGVEREEIIALDQPDTGEKLARLSETGRIVTIHTEEATLEDIFVELAGRGLV